MVRAFLGFALLAGPAFTAAPAASTHQDWRREATRARERGDYPAYLAAAEAAVALRPDSPRYRLSVASAYALNARPADALAALGRLADLGVFIPIEQHPDFAALRARPEFREVVAALAAQKNPRGRAAVAFELPAMAGIVEGLAYRRATGDYFFGDVRERCVWRRSVDGTLHRFSAPDAGLLGVFNLAVDETRHRLWIATSAQPEIAGYTPDLKGRGALCALDLDSGRVVRTCPLPADGRDHCLGDLLLAPDGTVFATDSVAPVIWRLPPGGDHLEPFVESAEFSSLQGLGLVGDGHRLLVTDYANGIRLVDLRTRRITSVNPPPHATLLGLDGLVVRGHTVVAVQNGIEPQRVVRITFDDAFEHVTDFTVLASSQPGLDDLTLLTEVAGHLCVVAQSGWAGFDSPKATPAPHRVQIFAVEP